MRIGSDAHKELFCRWFVATHRVYDPSNVPWPELSAGALERLRAIPIWSNVRAIEVKAGELIRGFAATQSDPTIRAALELQGVEEARHGAMLASMIERYALDVEEERLAVDASERAFITFGYKECLDAFLGYGAFRLARDVQFMPDAFMSIFADLMAEETRHIVFFINWIAYERARRKQSGTLQAWMSATEYLRAFGGLLRMATAAKTDSGFAGVGTLFGDLTIADFLATCLRENEREMRAFDPRLLRPRVIPMLGRIAIGIIGAADVIHGLAHSQKTANGPRSAATNGASSASSHDVEVEKT